MSDTPPSNGNSINNNGKDWFSFRDSLDSVGGGNGDVNSITINVNNNFNRNRNSGGASNGEDQVINLDDASPLSAPAFFLDSPLLTSEDTPDDVMVSTDLSTPISTAYNNKGKSTTGGGHSNGGHPYPHQRHHQGIGNFDTQLLFSKLDIKTEMDSNGQFGSENNFFITPPTISVSSGNLVISPSNGGNPASPQSSLYNFQYGQSSPLENSSLGSNPLLQTMNNYDGFGSSPISSPLMSSNDLARIIVQPERYQVVNYNIHPAPEIEFSQQFNDPITVQATLLYDTALDVREGFTNGDVQVLKVGSTKVSFPALHLNRMTPIKNSVQQGGAVSSLSSNQKDAFSYSIRFKIGDYILVSSTFKLVSACNQIPNGVDVRPRKNKTSSKMDSEAAPAQGNSQPKIVPSKTSSGKRRATNEVPEEDQLSYLHVKVRGDQSHRGFITISNDSSLKVARDEILKSPNYPKNFRFWFEKMATIVQPHQEDSIKAVDAVDGTCLILEPYDPIMQDIDDEILSLWLSKKDMKDPVVPILELIRKLFSVYGKEYLKEYAEHSPELSSLTIINGGISHFFANVTKNKEQSGMVGLEDFKLFLKFFGPARRSLTKVLNVYNESCFHGFARHADSVESLKGKPGFFLVRYSESQLKDGFFAFNVNRGNANKDVIENYSLRYHSDIECFIFRNKRYKTLREFVNDSEYAQILKYPLSKTTVEIVKESNYRNDTEFIRNSLDRVRLM